MAQLVMLGAFFLIIYFTMIRPQQKQQKQRKEMLSNLAKGDEIVTIGGIEGKIIAITDEKIVLKIAPKVNITILLTAVGQVMSEPQRVEEVEEDDDEALLEEE